tara:strand:+ start:197 stop:526 length:330 start_codon:yes stop_codon:yes gene_type:complete
MIEKHPYDRFLKTLVILNLFDLCITIFAVKAGLAEEMNPLMSYFLDDSVISFALFKIFVMQHALLVEYNRWIKKEKLSKKWVWYFLISVYGVTVLWNIITVSLHATGVI